jgi:hypothetical protein
MSNILQIHLNFHLGSVKTILPLLGILEFGIDMSSTPDLMVIPPRPSRLELGSYISTSLDVVVIPQWLSLLELGSTALCSIYTVTRYPQILVVIQRTNCEAVNTRGPLNDQIVEKLSLVLERASWFATIVQYCYGIEMMGCTCRFMRILAGKEHEKWSLKLKWCEDSKWRGMVFGDGLWHIRVVNTAVISGTALIETHIQIRQNVLGRFIFK